MKVNLTETLEEKPATPAADASATSTAVVPRQNMAPANYVSDDDAEGEFTKDDVEKTWLTIVPKTGKLADLFTPGDMILNKEFVIGGTKSPVNVIALGIRKRYQNDLDFDSNDEMGDVVDKAVEVVNRGGEIGYRPNGDKTSTHFWKPILQVMFLIERPENISPDAAAMFPYTIADKDYAIVGYTARTKTAYNGVAKALIQRKQAKGTVRGDVWQLSTKGESFQSADGSRSWIQAKLRSTDQVTDDIVKFLRENYDAK